MGTTAVGVLDEVRAIAGEWRDQRPERQARRHLEQADFDRLRAAGLLRLIVPAEHDGLWDGVAASSRVTTGRKPRSAMWSASSITVISIALPSSKPTRVGRPLP